MGWRGLLGTAALGFGAAAGGVNFPGLWQDGAPWWAWLVYSLPTLLGLGGGWWGLREESYALADQVYGTRVTDQSRSDTLRGEYLHALSNEGRLCAFETDECFDDPTVRTITIKVFTGAAQRLVPVLLGCLLLAGCYQPANRTGPPDQGESREVLPGPAPAPGPTPARLADVIAQANRAERVALARKAREIAARIRANELTTEEAQMAEWDAAIEGISKQKGTTCGGAFQEAVRSGGVFDVARTASAWDQVATGYERN